MLCWLLALQPSLGGLTRSNIWGRGAEEEECAVVAGTAEEESEEAAPRYTASGSFIPVRLRKSLCTAS